jgi:hypothetical protein
MTDDSSKFREEWKELRSWLERLFVHTYMPKVDNYFERLMTALEEKEKESQSLTKALYEEIRRHEAEVEGQKRGLHRNLREERLI